MADVVVSEKQCCACGKIKPFADFCNLARSKDGKDFRCKPCKLEYDRAYMRQNAARVKLRKVEYNRENAERNSKTQRAWRERNREHKLALDRKYAAEHAEEARARAKAWYWSNRNRSLVTSKAWREKNAERIREFEKARNQTEHRKSQRRNRPNSFTIRYRTDDKFRLHLLMSANMRHSLKNGIKNGRSWRELVPYSVAELKKHLMKTMPVEYTWEDFMKGKLHIDHITPVTAFNFTKPKDIDFRNCWQLRNLRLISASENCSKGAKLLKPFQPSFAGI